VNGLSDLLKYAFGLDLLDSSEERMPAWHRDANYLTCNFIQPPGVSGITYRAEWSFSMEPDSWQPVNNLAVPPQHSFRVPIDNNLKKFVRLKIVRK